MAGILSVSQVVSALSLNSLLIMHVYYLHKYADHVFQERTVQREEDYFEDVDLF